MRDMWKVAVIVLVPVLGFIIAFALGIAQSLKLKYGSPEMLKPPDTPRNP